MVLWAVLALRYRLVISGAGHIPRQGGALLLGNHVSFLDWLFVSLAAPRMVRFVILRDYYEKPLFRPVLRFFRAIPISPHGSKNALKAVAERLAQGELVGLFPEGGLSHTGDIRGFKRGFEGPAREAGQPIVPYRLDGMWGSRLSRAPKKEQGGAGLRRTVRLAFGPPLAPDSSAEAVRAAVLAL